jgi:hypothetical protein
MRRLLALLSTHRRRLARVVLLTGMAAVAFQLIPRVPRETQFEFALGDTHASVVELRVGFEQGGEELHGVSFGFPDGAPRVVRHTLNLPAGEFVLRCELRDKDGESRQVTRTLITPAPGVVHIALSEYAFAGRVDARTDRPARDRMLVAARGQH